MAENKKNGYYELFKNSDAGQPYHFTLKAPNHEVILVSENYASSRGARNGIDAVRLNGTEETNYEARESSSGEPYFVLKAANGQVIGVSEMYSSPAARDHGIKSVMKYCKIAVLIDHTVDNNGDGAVTSKPGRSNSNRYA